MASSNPQRYEPVSTQDDDDHISGPNPDSSAVPSSPPPPFSSRPASPSDRDALLSRHDPLADDAERTLAETFDSPSDDEEDEEENRNAGGEATRLIPGANASRQAADTSRTTSDRRTTQYPAFATTTNKLYGSGRANDGVFANLSAKPSQTDEVDEKPPSYEQAAADATPPYWETTILAPGLLSDDVYVDGLPVGALFSFVWNGMISMSFQIVGFLLTYLLHTTHAAKNGSRAGLGITLVQYGFSMKGASNLARGDDASGAPAVEGVFDGSPADPNVHDFDPAAEGGGFEQSVGGGLGGISGADWFAYILMIVGWFILIRSISDFLRARRHEQLVLASPERGLPVPVVAEGEAPANVV